MSKLRVYEVARDLGMENKALVALFQTLGVSDVRNHMSSVLPEQIERVKRHLDKQKESNVVERIRPTVIKRRTRAQAAGDADVASSPQPSGPVASEAPRVIKRAAASQAEPSAPRHEAPAETRPAMEVHAPAPAATVESGLAAAGSAAAALAAAGLTGSGLGEAEPARAGSASSARPASGPAAAGGPPSAPEATSAGEASREARPGREPSSHAGAGDAPRDAGQSASSSGVATASGTSGSGPAAPRPVSGSDGMGQRTTESAGSERAATGGARGEARVAALGLSESASEAQAPTASAPGRGASQSELDGAEPRAAGAGSAAGSSGGVDASRGAAGSPPPAEAAWAASPPTETERRSVPPKTGVEVWGGRPGVPMPKPAARTAPTPRRVQYDAKSGTAGGVGQRGRPPAGFAPPGGRPARGRPRGIGSLAPKRLGGQPVTQERSAHKKVVRIEESVGLQSLSGKIGVKATELLMKLMQLGMTGVNINSTLDADTAKIVASEFGWEVEDVAVSEEQALEQAQGVATEEGESGQETRPPVVTVMGHVDHGKTSLLDQIRKSNVVAGEAGGITQHIGAYSVETSRGAVTFLDTPGHEAFTAMRARGAQVTDVVVLVVAADDGVMPQTKEAVSHARAAGVPIVVAVNKIDKPDAQPERVRRELSELGLVPEEWGGDTMFCEVSAVTRQGIDALLDSILVQSEVLDLKASKDKPATGVVVEAELDRGRGPVATMLVTDGTLNRGDVILAGGAWGKVRAMIDDRGRQIAKAGPSVPVAIIGLNDVPSAGDPVHVVKDAKKAQEIAESRKTKERRNLMPTKGKISLEELARAMHENEQLELKVIVKADVQGSVEALSEALQRLSTAKVRVTVVHSAVGAITEGDVNLAVAAKAIIIGFNVRPAGKAGPLAQKEGVEIRQYNIIYDVIDEVKRAMEGLLAPKLVEQVIGRAEIRKLFKIAKAGWVAGCMVTSGVIRRTAMVRLSRDDAVVWQGKLVALKRFKDDVKEVKEGFDCGLSFDNYNDLKEGDIVEAYEIEEVRQTL